MNVPTFSYLRAASLEEASRLLVEHGERGRVLAGGTDLLVKMKHRRIVPPYLIDLKRVPGLDYIEYTRGEGLRIGPLATIEALKQSPEVRKYFPILHQAAAYMATIIIRNRATVAGNICNGSPSAETAPALIALGASARVLGPSGERIVAVEDFFTGPGSTVLGPGEVVAELLVPEPPAGSGGAYDKYSLRRMDVAVVGAAALVVPEEVADDGEAGKGSGSPGGGEVRLRDVRMVLSAVAPTPLRVKRAEEVLRGRVLTTELIGEAARVAAEESRPISDIRGSAETRRTMAESLTRQVLDQALRAAKVRVG